MTFIRTFLLVAAAVHVAQPALISLSQPVAAVEVAETIIDSFQTVLSQINGLPTLSSQIIAVGSLIGASVEEQRTVLNGLAKLGLITEAEHQGASYQVGQTLVQLQATAAAQTAAQAAAAAQAAQFPSFTQNYSVTYSSSQQQQLQAQQQFQANQQAPSPVAVSQNVAIDVRPLKFADTTFTAFAAHFTGALPNGPIQPTPFNPPLEEILPTPLPKLHWQVGASNNLLPPVLNGAGGVKLCANISPLANLGNRPACEFCCKHSSEAGPNGLLTVEYSEGWTNKSILAAQTLVQLDALEDALSTSSTPLKFPLTFDGQGNAAKSINVTQVCEICISGSV